MAPALGFRVGVQLTGGLVPVTVVSLDKVHPYTLASVQLALPLTEGKPCLTFRSQLDLKRKPAPLTLSNKATNSSFMEKSGSTSPRGAAAGP